MPNVYIANRSAHNYKPAEKYGELVYVTTGLENRFTTNHHARVWMEALRYSEPDDYIILASLNVICGIGCAIFAMMHGKLNLLLYRGSSYHARELELTEILNILEHYPKWIERLDVGTWEVAR